MKIGEFPKDALARVLQRASRTKFYPGRLPERITTYEAWSAIPPTTKEDLRSAYPLGLLAVPRERLATYHESSGTSGEPTPSYFTDRDWDAIASRFLRNGVGLSTRDVVLIKTPYSMVTTAHQMHRAARSRGALVVPADNRSSNMPYSKVVRLLKDLPITVSWCLPTETLLWAAAARLAGLDPAKDFPTLRAFLVAGETLSEPKRRRIQEIWGGVEVFQDYGSTETGSLAGECGHKRLHPWTDQLFFEILDGRLVVTPLDREAMPLVRYRVDDRVEIFDSPCPCGSSFPTISVAGRAEGAGSERELEEAVYSLPREQEVLFWRARKSMASWQIEIEGTPEAARLLSGRVAGEVRAVPSGTLVPHDVLTVTAKFQKPKFVFESHEEWDRAILY